MDLSSSPTGPSTYVPLPEAGLGVGFAFEEFENDATTTFFPPPADLLQTQQPSSVPQIDFGALEPFMGEDWVFDAPWEAGAFVEEEVRALEGWVIA